MQKIKKIIYILFVLFIMFPVTIYAATELSASTQSPVVGTSIYVQLDLNYGDKLAIGDMHLLLTYDPEYLEFENLYWIQSSGDFSSESGKVTIDKEVGNNWKSGPALQVKFKVKKEGQTKVDIARNGESHYENGDTIGQTFAGVSISSTKPSSQTLIGSLYVDGYTLQPTFSKTIYQYNLIVPSDVSVVNIIATKSDKRQTITGFGTKKLAYGDNEFPITVSAQDGSSRTYNITVHRIDDRTGDTSLTTLSVSDTNIKYEDKKRNYEATVSRSVDSVLITARTTDPNATLVGTGRKKLNIGPNTFTLNVASSGGRLSTYTITINRSNEELQVIEKSSKLKSIKANNLVLDLQENKTRWFYGTSKNTDSLSIEAIPESSTAQVEIIGNENLKAGLNHITIKVTEPAEKVEEGEKQPEDDVTEYHLIVYKDYDKVTIINEINNTKFNSDISYSTIESDSHIIPSSTLKYLKEHNYKLYYNVVNLYNGIIYQAILSENLPDTDLDASFKKINTSPITYETSLPSGTEILLYLEDAFLDGTNVKIYTYDEAGKYTLLTDGITVKDGYINFIANGQKNYIVTLSTLIREPSQFEKILNKYKNHILIAIGAIIIIILLINLINKKNKQRQSKEPLY